ncbi:4'-phosphopantetheinyl transferase family protein [Colwellia sp. RE-S-Sl-9]
MLANNLKFNVNSNTHCVDLKSTIIQCHNGLITTECLFFPELFNDGNFELLNIKLPESLKGAVPKRKAEFLAGRYLAKVALQTMGKPFWHIPIGENREPIWPSGIIGSISHSSNIAQCIISENKYYQYIGLDIEHWISENDRQNIESSIITASSEYESLIPHLPLNKALTVIFSAKESLFKALYKNIGEYFDFSAAQVTSGSFRQKELTLTLITDLSNTIKCGDKFKCTYTINNVHVVTKITVKKEKLSYP